MVNPTSIALVASEGSAIPDSTVVIWNMGNGLLKWTVTTPTVPWLTVTSRKGTNNATLVLNIDPLTQGIYDTTLVVDIDGGTATIPIRLTVLAPVGVPPRLRTTGPQSTILCPAGSIDILPGTSIQGMIDASPAGASFCLKAGLHALTSPITLASGNTFTGEFGAILDGTGWTTGDPTEGAFRAHSQDIDDVTIRNLVIRNMPQRAVHTYSSGECIDGSCLHFRRPAPIGGPSNTTRCYQNVTGLTVSNDMVVRANYIHHNIGPDPFGSNNRTRGGGFVSFLAQWVLFEDNEISYNGAEMKAASLSPNTIVRNNFVHHNLGNGIWYDGEIRVAHRKQYRRGQRRQHWHLLRSERAGGYPRQRQPPE